MAGRYGGGLARRALWQTFCLVFYFLLLFSAFFDFEVAPDLRPIYREK